MKRREFLVKTSLAVAALPTLLHSNRLLGANERLSLGVIGCGGRGKALMGEIRQFSKELNVETTALCDVWRINLERAAALVKNGGEEGLASSLDFRNCYH